MASSSKRRPVRVGVVGLGPIGVEVGKAILRRPDLKLVGAADLAPALAGQPLSSVIDGAPPRIKIAPSLKALAQKGGLDAIALTTSSRFPTVIPDLEAAIKAGVHVASTCEEMSAPGDAATDKAWKRLDARARKAGVTLLGTGVNPGFVMDRLVLALAGACTRVEKVTVERVVDAARRRGPLRKKVGEGLTVEEFKAGVKAGRLGHVGLRESAVLIARGLGWTLGKYAETVEPAVGPDGKCLGVVQRGRGLVGGKELITLSLDMYVGAPDPHDRILLQADPPMDALLQGGTQGDRGTVGTVVNALARLPRAPRGFITVADFA